jgi:hypothetical protein
VELLEAFKQLNVPVQDQIAIIHELRRTGDSTIGNDDNDQAEEVDHLANINEVLRGERRVRLDRTAAQRDHEAGEILLRTEIDPPRMLVPYVLELRQVRLREHLVFWEFELELFLFGRRKLAELVRILSSSTLVEPFRLPLGTADRRRPCAT